MRSIVTEIAIIIIALQKSILSQIDFKFLVILYTTTLPMLRKARSIRGLCEIPNGIIIRNGKMIQCIRQRSAAEMPM
jgi:hypothetical protein